MKPIRAKGRNECLPLMVPAAFLALLGREIINDYVAKARPMVRTIPDRIKTEIKYPNKMFI